MAKDAVRIALTEEKEPETPITPEAPAPAPAAIPDTDGGAGEATPEATPTEASTPEVDAASAITLETALLVFTSDEAKDLMKQFRGAEKFMVSLRAQIGNTVRTEQKTLNMGQYTFLVEFGKATYFMEHLAREAQDVLNGATVSDDGDVIASPKE